MSLEDYKKLDAERISRREKGQTNITNLSIFQVRERWIVM